MDDLLDKLAWAQYDAETAIKRAAAILRKKYNWMDCSEAKKELAHLARLTSPGRGKLMTRRSEITTEVNRQNAINRERRNARDFHPYAPCKDNYEMWERFNERNGLENAKAIKHVDDLLVIILGPSWSGSIDAIALKYPSGRIDVLETPDNADWRRSRYQRFDVEGVLSDNIYRLLPNDVMGRAVMHGGLIKNDLRKKRTTITYPDGEVTTIEWPYKTVRPSREDQVKE